MPAVRSLERLENDPMNPIVKCLQITEVEMSPVHRLGMSRALLKLSGSLVHDYATISDDSPSPNRASRARRAATSAGIS